MRQLRGSIPRQRERRSARTGGSDAAYLPAQFIEQRLGVFQVGGVEALGEGVVDVGQCLVSLSLLALSLPQPAQTHYVS